MAIATTGKNLYWETKNCWHLLDKGREPCTEAELGKNFSPFSKIQTHHARSLRTGIEKDKNKIRTIVAYWNAFSNKPAIPNILAFSEVWSKRFWQAEVVNILDIYFLFFL